MLITETIAPPTLAYPAGARALTAAETRRRRAVEQALTAVLEQEAFEEIALPLLDYAAPYAGIAADDLLRRTYHFTDRDGALLQLRSDFTPFVARAIAPSLEPDALPLRLFYRGDVVRAGELRSPHGGALFQIGGEVVGERDDLPTLRVVMRLCRAAGVRCTLALGDASIVNLLISASAPDAAIAERLRRSLESKQRERVRELLPLFASEPARLIDRLVRGVLEPADLLAFAPLRDVAERLLLAAGELPSDDVVTTILALDSTAAAGYYTGVRFQVLTPGGEVIAAGGRYDALYARFGASAPAIGFTFNVDVLERM